MCRLMVLVFKAFASSVAALIYTPVALTLLLQGRFTGQLAYAVTAGLLSSVVPYVTDLMALRWLSQHLSSVS